MADQFAAGTLDIDTVPTRDGADDGADVQRMTRRIPWRYVGRRFARMLLTIWLGATIIFFVPRLSPSDPIDTLTGRMLASGGSAGNSEEMVARFQRRFGLDQSLMVQYLKYLRNVVTFDNGFSLSSFPSQVDDLVRRALPWTIGLMMVSIIVAFVLGTTIGALLGWKRTPRWAGGLLGASLVFTALPAFMVGIVLVYVLGFELGWFPLSGAVDRGSDPGWTWQYTTSVIHHGMLPVTAIVLTTMGGWALSMRGMMITTAGEDYMTLGEAKGLRPRRLFMRYGVRNALLPQITSLAVAFGSIVGGAVIVEVVFAYPGLGLLLYNAILANDYTLIQGIVIYLIFGVALAVFVLDMIYPLLDPRIRLE